MTTLVVLLSVLLSLFTSFPADGYAGLLVAALIIWGGVKVVRQTIDPLLGVCPDRELVEELERKMLENPDICGVHDLILHNYGPGVILRPPTPKSIPIAIRSGSTIPWRTPSAGWPGSCRFSSRSTAIPSTATTPNTRSGVWRR